jgi:hypothetical protein
MSFLAGANNGVNTPPEFIPNKRMSRAINYAASAPTGAGSASLNERDTNTLLLKVFRHHHQTGGGETDEP